MTAMSKAFEQLRALRRLPKGWDYGRDGPADLRAYASAIMALTELSRLGADGFEVVPGVQGSISVLAFKGADHLELESLTNGRYTAFFERDGETLKHVTGISLAGLIKALEEFGWRSPRLFVSCTLSDTLGGWIDTPVSLSGIVPMVAVFPSSAPTVLERGTSAFATIFESSTINPPQASLRSSGEYRRLACREAFA